MAIYFAVFFSAACLVAVGLQFWQKLAINAEQPFLLPLIAMLAINMVALLAPQPVNLLYKGTILLGLMLSTLAVAFFFIPKTPEYVPVAHFFVIHFLYFVGFASATAIAIPSPVLLFILAYAFVIYWFARDVVREQHGAFIGYIVLMALMVWAASEVWVQHRQAWATAAFAGSLLLVVSNTALLVDRTRKPTAWVPVLVAVAFYIGQLLLAWSIWGLDLLSA